jgi:uncharacterized protein (TIGR04255 family)
MSQNEKFKIGSTEGFVHLSRAPIIEAVFKVIAQASIPWEEKNILDPLRLKLPAYPTNRTVRRMSGQLSPVLQSSVTSEKIGWIGYQFTSADEKQIALFQQDFFSFSRLSPYIDWNDFIGEALRLWKIHIEISKPTWIQRLDVRFINRFEVGDKPVSISDFFVGFPSALPDLNFVHASFFHEDTMLVPEHPYFVTLIKTVRDNGTPDHSPAFILDIDVHNTVPFEINTAEIEKRLGEMRWLKNKAFFGSITPELVEKLK